LVTPAVAIVAGHLNEHNVSLLTPNPQKHSVEPYSLPVSHSERCDLIQHVEAKQLFGKLSQDVFGRELRENQWSGDMEYWLDKALPLKRKDWKLIDWFYKLPK